MYSSCRGLHSPKLLRALFARSELTVSGRDAGDAYQDCVCWHHRRKEKECRMMQVQPKAKDEIQFTVLHHDRITFASVPTLQCHGKKYLSKVTRGEAQTYNILLHSVDKLPKNKNATHRRRLKFDGNLSLTVFEPTWNSQERVVRIGDKTLMTMKALKHLNNYIFKEKKAHPSALASALGGQYVTHAAGMLEAKANMQKARTTKDGKQRKQHPRANSTMQCSHQELVDVVKSLNVQRNNSRDIFRALWFYHWAPIAHEFSTVLSRLPHNEIQMDGTYKAIANVRSFVDWKTISHERYLAHGVNDTVDKEVDALMDPHYRREGKGVGDVMSVSQFVLSDEFEMAHLVMPCNGAGEPQYQLVPALFDVLIRKLQNLKRCDGTAEQSSISITSYLIKSDGMGKQKNIGLRTVRLLVEALKGDMTEIDHDRKLGRTTAMFRGHKLEITYAVCVWHRHRLIVKHVLGTTNDCEIKQATLDHAMIMHRMDKKHHKRAYTIVCSETEGMDEMTLQEFLRGECGRWWRDESNRQSARLFVERQSLRRFANRHNDEVLCQTQMFLNTKQAKRDREIILSEMRFALVRINPFQVRIFVAFLYGMCEYTDMLTANEQLIFEDRCMAQSHKHRAVSKCFLMRLEWMNMEQNKVVREKQEWCCPRFAPRSAMQYWMNVLQIAHGQCNWRVHCNLGFQCFGEAVGAVHSWWDFWEDEQRYRPLEQRASESARRRFTARQPPAEDEKAMDVEEDDQKDSQEKPQVAPPKGHPVVRRNIKRHAKSSKNVDNIRLMWNSGLSRGFRKRYANLSVENINKLTNRFKWRLNGWCGAGTAFIRCHISMINANLIALSDDMVLAHLEDLDEQQRDETLRVKPQLLRLVETFHQMHKLDITLWQEGVRTTLVPWFKVEDKSWKAQEAAMIQDYRLQFATDAVPVEMITACRVREWIALQDEEAVKSTPANWKACFEWLCPGRKFEEEAEEVIRQGFVAMGIDLNAEQRAEKEAQVDEYWPN